MQAAQTNQFMYTCHAQSERRHTERQLQRLERQVEELMSVPSAGGRWAELQGYVQGPLSGCA